MGADSVGSRAEVMEYDANTSLHTVAYLDDDDVEELNLLDAERDWKMTLMPYSCRYLSWINHNCQSSCNCSPKHLGGGFEGNHRFGRW